MIRRKSRFEIGKKAEALALAYLQRDLGSSATVSSGKFEGCDYLFKFKGKTQKVEVKSCSSSGRFMIHQSQYKALSVVNNSIDPGENLWVFIWFIGPSVLIKKLFSSQLSKIIKGVKLTRCMIGYGKTKTLRKEKYLKNRAKTVNKFTKTYQTKGEKFFRVRYKKMGLLYNISPRKIFNQEEY